MLFFTDGMSLNHCFDIVMPRDKPRLESLSIYIYYEDDYSLSAYIYFQKFNFIVMGHLDKYVII